MADARKTVSVPTDYLSGLFLYVFRHSAIFHRTKASPVQKKLPAGAQGLSKKPPLCKGR